MDKKKILTAVMAVFWICLFVAGCRKNTEEADTVKLEQLHMEVLVEDGVAEPESSVQKLQVSEGGRYRFHINCKTDKEGMLTGCVLYDEKGTLLFRCTGEWMEAESEELELKKGTYTVEFCYLTNKDDWKEFMTEKIEATELDSYVFQKNGKWNIDLEYGLEVGGTRSIYYYLGMVSGITFAILLLIFLKWFLGKMGGRVDWRIRKNSYDERQQLARGKAYKHAFFTLIFYMAVVSLISEFNGIQLFMSFGGIWIGVCLSVTVFAVICILEDAYMSLYENIKGVFMLFSIVVVMNLAGAVPIIAGRCPILENGAISVNCVNPVAGIMFFVIMAVFGGKVIYNKKHMEEEE